MASRRLKSDPYFTDDFRPGGLLRRGDAAGSRTRPWRRHRPHRPRARRGPRRRPRARSPPGARSRIVQMNSRGHRPSEQPHPRPHRRHRRARPRLPPRGRRRAHAHRHPLGRRRRRGAAGARPHRAGRHGPAPDRADPRPPLARPRGGLAPEASGATVYASPFEASIIAGERPSAPTGFWPRRPLRVYHLQAGLTLGYYAEKAGQRLRALSAPKCATDVEVRHGDSVGSLQAVHTPGHTDGSMSFYWPAEQRPLHRRRPRHLAEARDRLARPLDRHGPQPPLPGRARVGRRRRVDRHRPRAPLEHDAADTVRRLLLGVRL